MQTANSNATAIQVVKANEIKLYVGDDAWHLLSNVNFLASWDALYKVCHWATIFQSRSFVTTWYKAFRFKFSPIIIAAHCEGQLTGLFTLAMHESRSKKGKIVGAGNFEAEYHVWLSEAKHGTEFIKETLQTVLKQFPHSTIQLRFVPPDAPLQWMKELYWKRRCVADPYRRPLMDMDNPELEKLLNKSEFRRKINRIKRLGKVEFKRVTSLEEFEVLLNELTVMFDFRQGAKFNLNQFRNEPLKAAMYLELFKLNLLHVTVLKVNDKLLAALAAVTSQRWIHLLGINTHTPFNANFYSPGLVHFIMLGQWLSKEGIAVFDLTPGGDFYKDRLATRHDEVLELVVSNSRVYRLKRKLRQRYFESLRKAGKWPLGTMMAMKKRLYLLKARLRKIKQQGLVSTVVNKARHLIQPPSDKVFVAMIDTMTFGAEMSVRKNSLNDMLGFEAKGTWVTRWEFLEQAMHHYESGGSSYSFSDEDCLLGCVWIDVHPDNAKVAADSSNEGVPLLQELYCHPNGESQFSTFFKTVVQLVAKERNTDRVFVKSQDPRFCRFLENCGLKQITKDAALDVK